MSENPSQSQPADVSAATPPNGVVHDPQQQRLESRRWWIKLFLQPLLLLMCAAAAIAGLGLAQRQGWISSGEGGGHHTTTAAGAAVDYICPMMCTPPQKEPGRCPVCAMALVPATTGGQTGDARSIHIDPASRRIANIQTVPVQSAPMTRTLRTVGKLAYDEGTLRTIAAWTPGRLDRLYADYTGVEVKKGDHLALVYSPQLYSGQVELLLAKDARIKDAGSTRQRSLLPSGDLYDSARERLILLGMTEEQIAQLEQENKANSRMHLCAPSSGTVIEKMAVEGEYVVEGQAIYKLADLSTLWLMLELFPEDAAAVRYGQKVEAEVQSFPGRKFPGRVAFIDPNVDPNTRTVGVRVVIPNEDGLLRMGDYAKATLDMPLSDAEHALVYDPELANRWISPRHPHITAASAGACPICGVSLVPAAQFGFTDQPSAESEALVVPRDAVLMAGNNSVLYVETEPGRFEIRRVVLGPHCGDQIVIRSGVQQGEQVATRGNFLIDSQMQLAGNPSLIDPMRAEPRMEEAMSAEMIAALSPLSPDDRALVDMQKICPVAELTLGSMGTPKRVDVKGTPVFICCDGCRERLLSEPDKYLAKLAAMPHDKPTHDDSPEDEPQMDLPPIGVPQLIEPETSHPAANREAAQHAGHGAPSVNRVADRPTEAVR